MFKFLASFLDSNEREVKKLRLIAEEINKYEEEYEKFKEKDFLSKTSEFKIRLQKGETTLDGILPEAFALVREAAKRTINERLFDVQLMSAAVLHQGKVSEQKTGEGKTLSAVPALYLNGLTNKGVHLVTVNDYLARRDCGWMGPVFHLLGLSVSAVIHDTSYIYDPQYEDLGQNDWRLKNLRPVKKKEAYGCDVTYGINSEFGFDYLRDNMVSEISDLTQRGHYFAVVDEVDSILIDEARTPHIISAPDTEPTKKYYDYARLVDKLTPDMDYKIDEKLKTAHLTEHGIGKVEKNLGIVNLYEKDFAVVHYVENALKANTLFFKDKDYVVKDGEVIIVDEFTGRMMIGRRYSEGLHQAIEAKEGLTIQQESRTLATISLQNYFRQYEKLSGMTGTAVTEAEEFHKIYKLEVVVVPTHRPMVRKDYTDIVYKTQRAKYTAVVKEIEEMHKIGRPVLVGTTSIEKNEIISEFLKRKGIKHEVLNAKNHLKEAEIISHAGEKGAVTVATNMAGRGVDIILGGPIPNKYQTAKSEYQKEFARWQKLHSEITTIGGLHVIGTERHESRRIDNQLRGRAGRQGDPGSSRFFVALDDDIMRLFGGDQVSRLMTIFKLPEDVPLEHSMVSRAIEQAQVKVEGFNFDIRKNLVEYDDVMNKQREIIYKARRKIIELSNESFLKEEILTKISEEIKNTVQMYSQENQESDPGQQSRSEKILDEFISIIPFDNASRMQLEKQLMQIHSTDEINSFLINIVKDVYNQKEKQVPPEIMRQVERFVNLSVIDSLWMDHLDGVDDLREGIGLRGYGQKDPLVEYKHEAFNMFERLIAAIDDEVVHRIFKVQIQIAPEQIEQMKKQQEELLKKAQIAGQKVDGSSPSSGLIASNAIHQPADQQTNKLGRNDPCWCGSGKKWKKCHYPKTQ
jgi:preprotein translocase subunit SecA